MALTFKGPVPIPAPQTSGLNILVTGAGRGIGYELVRQYAAAHKDNLVFAGVRDVNTDNVRSLASFANVRVVLVDVVSEESIRASVAAVSAEVNHVDVLIANAGINGTPSARNPTTVSVADFNAVFQTNVVGVLLTIQAYLPLLQRSSNPKVISVGSTLGSNQYVNVFGRPTTSYGVSKAALNYLTSAFRYAVPDVAFLTIHPGWVDTDMGKSAGGSPPTKTEDSAQAIRYYIAEKGIKNTGEYLDCMSGELIPY